MGVFWAAADPKTLGSPPNPRRTHWVLFHRGLDVAWARSLRSSTIPFSLLGSAGAPKNHRRVAYDAFCWFFVGMGGCRRSQNASLGTLPGPLGAQSEVGAPGFLSCVAKWAVVSTWGNFGIPVEREEYIHASRRRPRHNCAPREDTPAWQPPPQPNHAMKVVQ